MCSSVGEVGFHVVSADSVLHGRYIGSPASLNQMAANLRRTYHPVLGPPELPIHELRSRRLYPLTRREATASHGCLRHPAISAAAWISGPATRGGGSQALAPVPHPIVNCPRGFSAVQTATMEELDADRHFNYDTLNRLVILDSPPEKPPCGFASPRNAASCQGLGGAVSKREAIRGRRESIRSRR
jgi:hypothetical protein